MAKIPNVFMEMIDMLVEVRKKPGKPVLSKYNDIRNMSKNQLRTFYYENKSKAHALLKESNNRDMLLSSKVTYARNRLILEHNTMNRRK